MSFPFLNYNEINTNTSNGLEIFKEIAWDFELNIPIFEDGKEVIVEKKEALKVWIWKALKTERFRYLCYTWDFGSEIDKLIGSGLSRDATKLEIERYVTECLLCNPYIESITDIQIELKSDGADVSITVNTVYGEVDVNNV